jgi:putative YhbY family RNA-binding protein
MPALTLTPAQRRQHRADAHHLDPVVQIGGDGLTPAVQREVDRALSAHGLIKVRAFVDDRASRDEMLANLCDALNAAPVQHIGKLFVLFRPKPAKARTTDADAERDSLSRAPKVVKIVKFPKTGNRRPSVSKVRVLGNQRVTQGGSVKRAERRQASAKKSGG